VRKLFIQLLLLLGSVGLVAGLVLAPALQRPYLDAFYARFTSPPAGSLVLGTSRSAQAVLPAELQSKLGAHYAGPWLNYAFTLFESPYGPAYLASIRRKLAPTTRHGLFIVAVDPWALSLEWPKEPGQPVVFPEDKSLIGQMQIVSQNPNLEYLAHHLNYPLYQLALHDTTTLERLHPDGWLEIVLPPPTTDTVSLRQRTAEKLATYRPLAAASYLSAARLHNLRQLISFLKLHGQVVVVRLPTGPALAALEKQYQPQFDQLMQRMATSLGAPYLNYIEANYPTNDGNHLWRGAARTFSQRLASDIARLSPD